MALFYYAILDTTNLIIDTIMAQRFEFLTLLWHTEAMAQPGRVTVSLIRGTVAKGFGELCQEFKPLCHNSVNN